MDQLQAMQTFVRVAEAGSFTAAADQLDLARSAVTRQIAFLEARLGAKLIARSTRRLTLTPAGSDYLERCREILALVGTAESELAYGRQVPRGRIRMSVPISFGVQQVLPLLVEFMERYPEVTVDAVFDDRRVNLIEDGFDLAIRISETLPQALVARRIGRCRVFTLASPDYLARCGTPQHPDDLAGHDCLDYTGNDLSSWPFRVDGRPRRVAVRARLRANNGEALLEAAARGLGVNQSPSFIAADALRAGRVVPLLGAFSVEPLGIHVLFPGARYLPHRVRALVDFLAGRMGDAPAWEAGLG